MSRLSLTLLGTPQIVCDGTALSFAYRKVAALLIYLAVETRQAHTRAALAGLLWSDTPDQVARQSLSQALTTLRVALGERAVSAPGPRPPLLLTDADTIQLNPAALWETDIARFLSLIAASESHPHYAWRTCAACGERLQQAAALYRGDFLDHFVLRDGPLFEEWALLLREQLRQQALGLYERLAEQAEWRGEYVIAIGAIRKQLTLDPWADMAHRELIRLLALNGQSAVALAHYDYLRRTLSHELKAEPDSTTRQLVERIREAHGDAAAFRRFPAMPVALPSPPSPLLGREEELQNILHHLRNAGPRALTISGPPGVGKTRLALAAADALRYDFADGVWFVELAPLADAGLAPMAIAHFVGVRERPHEPIAATLISELRKRHLLLVLDNCEHLPALAPFVADLLAGCPTLHILATSRAALHIRAEQQFALAPLALPAIGADLSAIRAAAAVQLLVARAQALRPELALSSANAADLAAICARLDGLPLAIELLAAPVANMGPAAVLGQLDARLMALSDGPRDLPARQQTLRATIAWSVDRLRPPERQLFATLGLFAGGGTLQALKAVVGGPEALEPLLEALQQQSLVQAQLVAGELRYTLLETIRAYALELLAASDLLDTARYAHTVWLVEVAEHAYTRLLGADGPQWSARIAAEFANLRATRHWAIDHGLAELALRMSTGIWRFHWQRGFPREGREWIAEALAYNPAIAPELHMKALRAAGVLSMGASEHGRAIEWLEAARNLAMRHEHSEEYSAATGTLGLILREQGQLDKASAYLEEAVMVNRTMTDNPSLVKFPLIALAGLYGRIGNIDRAAVLYEECLQINRELEDSEGTANAIYGLAFVAHARGEYQRARQLGAEALALYETMSHQFGIAWVVYLFGDIARDEARFDEALVAYRRSLAIWHERDDLVSASFVLDDIAMVLSQLGEWQPAVILISAAAAICAAAEVALTPGEQAKRQAALDACRDQLGSAAFEAAYAEGRSLSPSQAALLASGELAS